MYLVLSNDEVQTVTELDKNQRKRLVRLRKVRN